MFENINAQLNNDLVYCYDLYRDLNEHWMEIEGYENYSVSIFGRVRNDKTGRIMKPRTNNKGYSYVGFLDTDKIKNFLVHRLVANAFLHNHDNKKCVDHNDHNPKNNNVNNLRWCSVQENQWNKSKHSNNTSGFVGVTFHRDSNKYISRINIDGKRISLGYYLTPEEASEAYQMRAKQLFGDFYNNTI